MFLKATVMASLSKANELRKKKKQSLENIYFIFKCREVWLVHQCHCLAKALL